MPRDGAGGGRRASARPRVPPGPAGPAVARAPSTPRSWPPPSWGRLTRAAILLAEPLAVDWTRACRPLMAKIVLLPKHGPRHAETRNPRKDDQPGGSPRT